MESAAGNGAFLTGGARHFPEGSSIGRLTPVLKSLGFGWDLLLQPLLSFLPSRSSVSCLGASKPRTCHATKGKQQDSPAHPSLPFPPTLHHFHLTAGRCMSVEQGSSSKQGAHFHDSSSSEGMLAARPLLRSPLTLPQAAPNA